MNSSVEKNKKTLVLFGASGDLAKRYLLPALSNLRNVLDVVPVSRKDYPRLAEIIPEDSERVFYLAIPADAVPETVKMIGLAKYGQGNVKILLEKPFGKDLESANFLLDEISKYYEEEKIYRVDHYLAKISARELATSDWPKNGIASIEIIASEAIGIEDRVNFYEQTGALRDFVQSHLLELLAVTLAGSFDSNMRYQALKDLAVVCDITKNECVKRGQYEGYREEVGNPVSNVETFVSVNLVSNDPKWKGVQMILSTGKALSEKRTEIKISYKDGSNKVFAIMSEPEAYRNVILAAIEGRRELFISSGEVRESWRILEDIQQTWKGSSEDLIIYKKGTPISKV
jgi:glucose-6-phosphate 1-dehydrogenase